MLKRYRDQRKARRMPLTPHECCRLIDLFRDMLAKREQAVMLACFALSDIANGWSWTCRICKAKAVETPWRLNLDNVEWNKYVVRSLREHLRSHLGDAV